MQTPPPPTQQQAEKAQQARHTAELAVAGMFVSSDSGGGGGSNESSSLQMVKILGILSVLAARAISNSFESRGRDKSLLDVRPDAEAVAEAVLRDAHANFMSLKHSDLPEEQKATLWATWAHSEVSNAIAEAVDDNFLARPEYQNKSLRKVWISRSDARVRPLHARLHGKVVATSDDFWRWPETGQRLRWPGDKSAPLEAVIGCRCIALLTWADQESVSRTIRKIVEHTAD